MSEKKTPEQAAEAWAMDYWSHPAIPVDVRDNAVAKGTAGFLAGRDHFIENELRELLEDAREEECGPNTAWRFSIDDIIKKAKDAACARARSI